MERMIKDIINKVGIKDVGFCSYGRVSEHLLDCRAKARIPNGAKTVIVCTFPYKVQENNPKKISRYAAVPDYHRVCKEYLQKACDELAKEIKHSTFEWFIDNSPIPEVHTAAAAGLGVIGQNGLLITKEYGSFVFIGEIVTDLELEFEDLEIERCLGCGKCMQECPKQTEGAECLSAVSQKKGELTNTEIELLKKYKIVWGCDICAESCPLNKDAKPTYIKEFTDGYRNEYILNEDIVGRAYEWRGKNPVRRNCLLQK